MIAAAGSPRAQIQSIVSKIKSSAMVPINGKPIIGWILDKLIKQQFTDFIILVPEKDVQFNNYISNRYTEKTNIRTIEVEDSERPLGLAHSMYEGLSQIDFKENGLLLILGQTICEIEDFTKNDYFNKDFVVYDTVSTETSRWCYILTDKDNCVRKFVDKPEVCDSLDKALIGIYYFKYPNLLFNELSEVVKDNPRAYFSKALEKYNVRYRFQAIKSPVNKWFDCGNVIGLCKTRTSMIDVREHNPIVIEADKGVIHKKNENNGDLHEEYLWYKSLPDELLTYAPHAINFEFKKEDKKFAQFSLEYYGYPSLAEAWIYDHWHTDVWFWTIEKLFTVLRSFRKYKSHLNIECYLSIYWDKTIQRIEKLKSINNTVSSLLNADQLIINGMSHCGWESIKDIVHEKLLDLYHDNMHTTLIHGDFHFGNILFDVNTRLVKLIDPRGNFGGSGIFGDCKYDLAKLRHSVSGGYNFVSHDLYKINFTDNTRVDFTLPYTEDHIKIVKWFDEKIIQEKISIDEIKLIEGLLYISMLPLHNDHPERQKAFLTRGIMLLNEVVYLEKEKITTHNFINLYKI